MSNFLALIDKYKFGLIATLSVYVAIFIYLQMDSYKLYFPIEPFHEGSHVDILENDIKLKPENILLVKEATFRCLLFPMLFRCTSGSGSQFSTARIMKNLITISKIHLNIVV